jgi:hypothetical protein
MNNSQKAHFHRVVHIGKYTQTHGNKRKKTMEHKKG